MIILKKAISKKQLKKITFLFIPETESKVRKLRLPIWVIQVVFVVFVVFAIFEGFTVKQVVEYKKIQANNDKNIYSMVSLNVSQKKEISNIQNNTIALKKQIDDNIRVLGEIKKTIGLSNTNNSFDNAILSSELSLSKMISDETNSTHDMSNEIVIIDVSLEELSKKTIVQKEEIKKSMAPINAKLAYLRAVPTGKPINDSISCAYGSRINPITHRGSEFHKGVDLGAKFGVNVYATGDGEIIFAGWNGGYGNVVIISHGYGFTTLYAHNSKLLVKIGDKVKRGQALAKTGSTGRSTGPHVHYEVKVNGKNVNPVKYF